MKRMVLVFALSLVVGLALTPKDAGAHHRSHGVHAACCVFIAPGHSFGNHGFRGHPRFFIHQGLVPFPSATVIVVNPAPRPVWVPGFWWWDGFQWLWVPEHWAVPGG